MSIPDKIKKKYWSIREIATKVGIPVSVFNNRFKAINLKIHRSKNRYRYFTKKNFKQFEKA